MEAELLGNSYQGGVGESEAVVTEQGFGRREVGAAAADKCLRGRGAYRGRDRRW